MADHQLLFACRCQNCFVPVSAERMDECRCTIVLGIYRNIPFALIGLLIIVLFYQSAKKQKTQVSVLCG